MNVNLGNDDFHVDPKKIKVIQEWSIPKNIGELQNFHDLASFYRRFVKASLLSCPFEHAC